MAEPIPPLTRISNDFDAFFKELFATLSTWKGNFVRNSTGSFQNMSTQNWIRLTIAVCTYLLIRPYLLKFAARAQEKQMQKAGLDPGTAMNGNDLRVGGQQKHVAIPGVDSDSEEVGKEEWGRKARVRQRKVVKKALEIHEENLREKGMESDEDIRDLLED